MNSIGWSASTSVSVNRRGRKFAGTRWRQVDKAHQEPALSSSHCITHVVTKPCLTHVVLSLQQLNCLKSGSHGAGGFREYERIMIMKHLYPYAIIVYALMNQNVWTMIRMLRVSNVSALLDDLSTQR